jgi:hypothetical protein
MLYAFVRVRKRRLLTTDQMMSRQIRVQTRTNAPVSMTPILTTTPTPRVIENGSKMPSKTPSAKTTGENADVFPNPGDFRHYVSVLVPYPAVLLRSIPQLPPGFLLPGFFNAPPRILGSNIFASGTSTPHRTNMLLQSAPTARSSGINTTVFTYVLVVL